MNSELKHETKHFYSKRYVCLIAAIGMVLLILPAKSGLAVENDSVQHFKMVSTIEYSGKTQFRNQVETLLTAKKQSLSDDKVKYFISTNDFDLVTDSQSSSGELTFTIDKKTRRLLGVGKASELFEKINNQCVRSFKKITKDDIGKTWKQTFYLSFLDKSLPNELKFTLTAIGQKTESLGELIAVRALSEPFTVNTPKAGGGQGPVKSKISAVYVFDSKVEEIYLSISVFDAETKVAGFKEKLHHEVATYMTDAFGESVDLSGLDKKFEKFVQKLNLTKKPLKVAKKSSLPKWASSQGLGIAQVANICAATACEGALNPVSIISIPIVQTVGLQGSGLLGSIGPLAVAGETGTVGGSLTSGVTAMSGFQVSTGTIAGMGLGTAAAIAGGTIAVAGGGGGGGSSSVSP